jgi:hypothetical protein
MVFFQHRKIEAFAIFTLISSSAFASSFRVITYSVMPAFLHNSKVSYNISIQYIDISLASFSL